MWDEMQVGMVVKEKDVEMLQPNKGNETIQMKGEQLLFTIE